MPHTLAINKFNNCHKEKTYESVSQISFQRTESTPDMLHLEKYLALWSRTGYRFKFQESIRFRFSRFIIHYHDSIRAEMIGLVLVRERAELQSFICCSPLDGLDMRSWWCRNMWFLRLVIFPWYFISIWHSLQTTLLLSSMSFSLSFSQWLSCQIVALTILGVFKAGVWITLLPVSDAMFMVLSSTPTFACVGLKVKSIFGCTNRSLQNNMRINSEWEDRFFQHRSTVLATEKNTWV